MKNTAVFVDIDNTMVKGTTLKILGQYFLFKRKINVLFFIRLLFWYLQYKRNRLNEFDNVLEHVLDITQDWDIHTTNELMRTCFDDKIKPRIYKEIVDRLNEHHEKGHRVYLVSSTILPIAQLLVDYLGFGVPLATEPKIQNNCYTGEIIGEVCYGENKKERILEIVRRENIDLKESYSYSDHISDLPLLEMVGHPAVVNPNSKLKKIAQTRKWEIIRTKAIESK